MHAERCHFLAGRCLHLDSCWCLHLGFLPLLLCLRTPLLLTRAGWHVDAAHHQPGRGR